MSRHSIKYLRFLAPVLFSRMPLSSAAWSQEFGEKS